MSRFPTNDSLFLMLCDDFRHEGDGKLSIFGAFSDTVLVVLSDPQAKIMLTSLGIYLAFRDGFGHFKMTMRITSPNKTELLPERERVPVEKTPDEWMNVAIKLQPFSGTTGDYILRISLEDESGTTQEYVKPFYIKLKPQAPIH